MVNHWWSYNGQPKSILKNEGISKHTTIYKSNKKWQRKEKKEMELFKLHT
jgi:hypothetical protein